MYVIWTLKKICFMHYYQLLSRPMANNNEHCKIVWERVRVIVTCHHLTFRCRIETHWMNSGEIFIFDNE